MTIRLNLELDPTCEALLRVLGVVFRRQWTLSSVTAAPSTDDTHFVVELRLRADDRRDPESIVRQLVKLHDVRKVAPPVPDGG